MATRKRKGLTADALVIAVRSGLEKRLARRDRRPFPEIAVEVLQEAAPHETIEPTSFLRSILTGGGCSTRHRAPEIVALYEEPRFVINAHLWLDTYAVPHSHNWEGAFQVLVGESLYSTYRFEPTKIDEPSFKVGRVHTIDTCMLKPGDIRRVDAGLACVHSIFHVDRPSLNVSIRGDVKDRSLTVWRAGVCEETDRVEGTIETRLKAMRVLASVNRKECDDAIEELVRSSDLRTLNLFLGDAMVRHSDRREVRRVALAQRKRLGTAIDEVVETAEEHMRARWFIDLRGKFTSPEHRFFLGLMTMCADRASVYRMIRERYPRAKPAEILTRWVRDFTRPSNGHPAPTEVELGEESIRMLRLLLDHDSVADAARSARGTAPGRLREIERRFAAIRLFRPLFAASS